MTHAPDKLINQEHARTTSPVNHDDTIKNELRERAHALGFQLFGVAAAAPLAEDFLHLHAWIQRGDAAGMTHMTVHPERRADAGLLLSGARSVVMLGMSYAQQLATVNQANHREGRVARFALGQDYHNVLRPRVQQLADWILLETGAHSHCFVDSGPLLERAYAREAGLGFVGKNNCLTHPRYGSWILLAGLVTTLEMQPDEPLGSQCRGCTACLDACPTGALCEPYRLDARRCLSYWTIETHDGLDPGIMNKMGDRLFGCDTCQEACPFNAKGLQCAEPDLRPPEQDAQTAGAPTLQQILEIPSNREFERLFRHKSLLRARLKGLLRNASVVTGNLHRSDLHAHLERLAHDETKAPSVRETAQWAIQQMEAGTPTRETERRRT